MEIDFGTMRNILPIYIALFMDDSGNLSGTDWAMLSMPLGYPADTAQGDYRACVRAALLGSTTSAIVAQRQTSQ